MLGTFEFFLATSALLLTPGPTNTLMALAGARLGWQGVTGRIMAELTAYLLVTIPLIWVGAAIIDRWPDVGRAMQFCAALWVGWLAITLWRTKKQDESSLDLSAVRVLVTTLLNPKGLVFGLILLPQGGLAGLPTRIAIFSALIVVVALLWTFGGILAGGARGQPNAFSRAIWLQRMASVWLASLSAGLLGSSLKIW